MMIAREPAGCGQRYRADWTGQSVAAFHVSDAALKESVLIGLVAALELGVTISTERFDDEDGQLGAAAMELDLAETALATAEIEERSAYDALAILGALPAEHPSRQFATQRLAAASEQRVAAEERHVRAKVELEVHEARIKKEALPLDRLVEGIWLLRDPHRPESHAFIRRTIRSLEFTSLRTVDGVCWSWSGQMSFTVNGGSVVIPFSGQETNPVIHTVDLVAERALSGIPPRTPLKANRRDEVMAVLGLPPAASYVTTIDVPALFAANLATWIPDQTERILADYEPLSSALADRLAAVVEWRTLNEPSKWTSQRFKAESEDLAALAAGEPVSDLRWLRRLSALDAGLAKAFWEGSRTCPVCSGTRYMRLIIHEASGYVCLDCRADQAGVVWPLEFDRFRAYPPHLPDANTPPATTKRSRIKNYQRRNLSSQVRAAVVKDYQSGLRVRDISDRHDLGSASRVYDILKDAGVQRRRA